MIVHTFSTFKVNTGAYGSVAGTAIVHELLLATNTEEYPVWCRDRVTDQDFGYKGLNPYSAVETRGGVSRNERPFTVAVSFSDGMA